MMFSPEATVPWFTAELTASSDTAGFIKGGEWRPEELRSVYSPLGRTAVIGQCLASEGALNDSSEQALGRHDPRVLTHLPGSYAAMLLRENEFTVMADLVGQFPIFYKHSDGRTVISSEASRLRQEGAAPDRLTLAAQIGCSGVRELVVGRTAFEGINRLEAGHALHADSSGVRVAPYETFASDPFTTTIEAAEALREALQTAVRSRASLGRQLTADCSGIDSTSIAFLAAREVARLPVFTYHDPAYPTDDLEYVQACLQLAEGKPFEWHTFQVADQITMYQNMAALPLSDQPDQSVVVGAFEHAYFQALRESGSELHLTGNGGDALFDVSSVYLTDLIHARKYRQMLSAAYEIARIWRTAPYAVITKAWRLAHTNLPE
ncbi:MAG: asparagine synthase-related protein, partial [Patescibacteria group bacterium]